MRIGIDIDGVLVDVEKFTRDYGTKYCVENGLPIELKEVYYDEAKVFGWTEEECGKFWNKYMEYYATKYPSIDFASEVIKKLKEEGNEIYIITARNEYGLTSESYGKMKEFVKGWLEDNEIIYDRIIYTEGSKLPYCVGNYIDIMIDDAPDNVIDISSKIPVLCFHAGYNKELEGKNITRVYSWYDIYDKIHKII